VACLSGDTHTAATLCLESLTRYHVQGNGTGIATCLEALVVVSVATRPELAARLGGAAVAMRVALGAAPAPPDGAIVAEALSHARTTIGDAAFDVAWSAGQALHPPGAVSLALAELDAARLLAP
jgi:hypothetical protein